MQTIPTIGFNVETLQYKNIKVSGSFDFGVGSIVVVLAGSYIMNVGVADSDSLFTLCLSIKNNNDNNKNKPNLIWQFQVWDLGGQTSIRPYWRCYYPNTDAIVFVVDSADVERMNVAKGELAAMLEEDELNDSILLVFANKQDQKGALNAQQISDALGLPEVRNRQWSIQETSALQGKGLFEGFDWLVQCIKGVEE